MRNAGKPALALTDAGVKSSKIGIENERDEENAENAMGRKLTYDVCRNLKSRKVYNAHQVTTKSRQQ